MTILQTTIRQALEADATLVALLTGGIHDANELERTGLTIYDAIKDSVGRIRPCAVLRWRPAQGYGPHFNGAHRTFEIYLYEDVGFTSITPAKERIYQLLHRTKRTADYTGVGWINWLGDRNEYVAVDLGNASADMMKFEVIYTRKES